MPAGKLGLLGMYVKPCASAAAGLVVAVGDGGRAGLLGELMSTWMLPPEPRADGAPPLNSESTPKVMSSVSVTSAIVTSMTTCRCGTSSLRSAASITEYSAAVAMMSSVLLSLSATTCKLRTMPDAPGPPGPPVAEAITVVDDCGGGVGVLVPVTGFSGWNVGGGTILPAGPPRAARGG